MPDTSILGTLAPYHILTYVNVQPLPLPFYLTNLLHIATAPSLGPPSSRFSFLLFHLPFTIPLPSPSPLSPPPSPQPFPQNLQLTRRPNSPSSAASSPSAPFRAHNSHPSNPPSFPSISLCKPLYRSSSPSLTPHPHPHPQDPFSDRRGVEGEVGLVGRLQRGTDGACWYPSGRYSGSTC